MNIPSFSISPHWRVWLKKEEKENTLPTLLVHFPRPPHKQKKSMFELGGALREEKGKGKEREGRRGKERGGKEGEKRKKERKKEKPSKRVPLTATSAYISFVWDWWSSTTTSTSQIVGPFWAWSVKFVPERTCFLTTVLELGNDSLSPCCWRGWCGCCWWWCWRCFCCCCCCCCGCCCGCCCCCCWMGTSATSKNSSGRSGWGFNFSCNGSPCEYIPLPESNFPNPIP